MPVLLALMGSEWIIQLVSETVCHVLTMTSSSCLALDHVRLNHAIVRMASVLVLTINGGTLNVRSAEIVQFTVQTVMLTSFVTSVTVAT
jgi:hypothetical protein